jgi:hypothetical protein
MHVTVLSLLLLASVENVQASCGGVATGPINARVGVNATLQGTHSYVITNRSNQTVVVTVTAVLQDSEGGRISEQKTIYVGPRSESRGTLRTFFIHSYRRPGGVILTATTEVSGGATARYTARSSFAVGR